MAEKEIPYSQVLSERSEDLMYLAEWEIGNAILFESGSITPRQFSTDHWAQRADRDLAIVRLSKGILLNHIREHEIIAAVALAHHVEDGFLTDQFALQFLKRTNLFAETFRNQ